MDYKDYKRKCGYECKIEPEQKEEQKTSPKKETKKITKRPKRNILDIKRDLINNLKEFLDDLLETLPEEEDLLIMRIFLIEQVPIDILINQINRFVLPHRNKIKNRDEEFFLNDDGIFGKIEGKKVLHFKDIWKSNRLSSDDKKTIFVWFDQFVNIMDELNKNEF